MQPNQNPLAGLFTHRIRIQGADGFLNVDEAFNHEEILLTFRWYLNVRQHPGAKSSACRD
jgi:hypothetical protein